MYKKYKNLKNISFWETENLANNRWRLKYIFTTIKNYHFKNFIDFGCDTGYFTEMVAGISDTVIAVDINEKAIEFAKQTKRCPNVTWVVQDMRHYKIAEDNFDGIAFLECLPYYDEKTKNELIARAYKGLRKEGLILICGAIQLPKEKWTYDESKRFKFPQAIEDLLVNHNFIILSGASVMTTLKYINGLVNRIPICMPLFSIIMKIANHLPGRFTRLYYVLAKK